MQEEWRPIVGFEGFYEISNLGRVKSLYKNKEKILKPGKVGSGYLQVVLCKNGNSYMKKVHRLVGEAFIVNTKNKPCIDHIDCDKTNNCENNLRWCSHRENNNNFITRKRNSLAKLGSLHPKAKSVICLETNCIFCCVEDAAKKTGICRSGISQAASNKQRTAGGYHWRFTK